MVSNESDAGLSGCSSIADSIAIIAIITKSSISVNLFNLKNPDGNIFKDEYVELGIKPPNSRKVYRIAVNPIADSRYDSVFKPGKRNRMTEDRSWNGIWQFAYKLNMKKSRWNQNRLIWTAWFRIPFADFGVKSPVEGEK